MGAYFRKFKQWVFYPVFLIGFHFQGLKIPGKYCTELMQNTDSHCGCRQKGGSHKNDGPKQVKLPAGMCQLDPFILPTIDRTQLKTDYKLVEALCEQSGFRWEEKHQMVTAPDDVWDKYINVCHFLSLLSIYSFYLCRLTPECNPSGNILFWSLMTIDMAYLCDDMLATGTGTFRPRDGDTSNHHGGGEDEQEEEEEEEEEEESENKEHMAIFLMTVILC
jgi:hypothetical protein